MYLRFTTKFINQYKETDTGIFNALGYIRDHSLTQDEDSYKLKVLTGWFNAYLEKPTKLSNASNKSPAAISLSWFKDSAKEHIQRIYELIEILEKYDLVVERFISKNPGYIVYEDDFQISAVPFKPDRNKVL
jgi:hypothetical protein